MIWGDNGKIEKTFMDEVMAAEILQAAIFEGRAAELLECLFDGGTCTLDNGTRRLVLVSGDALSSLSAGA